MCILKNTLAVRKIKHIQQLGYKSSSLDLSPFGLREPLGLCALYVPSSLIEASWASSLGTSPKGCGEWGAEI